MWTLLAKLDILLLYSFILLCPLEQALLKPAVVEPLVSSTMLQFNNLKVDQRKKSYIKINTRELDKKLCTRLFILYTKLWWPVLLLLWPTLNNHILTLRLICILYIIWHYLSKTFYTFLYDFMTCDYYCDHVIWCDWCVTAWSLCHSNPNPKFQNRKINQKNEKEILNEKTSI